MKNLLRDLLRIPVVVLPKVDDDVDGIENLDKLVSAKDEHVEIHEIGHQKSVIIATKLG